MFACYGLWFCALLASCAVSNAASVPLILDMPSEQPGKVPIVIGVVTQTVTVTASPSPTPTSAPSISIVTVTYTPPPTSSAASSPPPSPTVWSLPPLYTDLEPFSITHYAGGKSNMAIVTATASPPSSTAASAAALYTASAPPQVGSLLRVLYPEGSINPANHPQGGAQFYAHPLDITKAKNVTLAYDVYFPPDFEFVMGGKLPGLFGGKESCSGGDAALDCFSTRLMWRTEGAGELYLYAPKDKQTKELCSLPPESDCSATYGLSIARGAFNWTRGGWTHVAQTVVLNTPGVQDGYFRLDVDGATVIDRSDVYYRGFPGLNKPEKDGGNKGDDGNGGEEGDGDETPPSAPPPPPLPDDGDEDKGLLGGLLGSLPLLGRRSYLPFLIEPPSAASAAQAYLDQSSGANDSFSAYQAKPKSQSKAKPKSSAKAHSADASTEPIGFTGLFFSTFFGGHESEWASPKDQYVHFASFAMRING